MRDWLVSFGLAFVGIALIDYLLPFHDYYIELQPDGKSSLGMISAPAIKLFSFLLGAVPIYFVGSIAAMSARFRSWSNAWIAAATGFLPSVILIVSLRQAFTN